MSSSSSTEIILHILLSMGIILIVTKYFAVTAKKFGFTQVAGMIIAGLLLRFIPWFKNFGGTEPNFIYQETNNFISFMAEIGVILIMFSAGLGTNLKSLIKSGIKSTIIACCGVFVPLIMGTVMALCFWGFDGFGTQEFFKSVFIGTILTATSVSISVAVLKELGKIKSDVGQTIISSAIIDDVIGIIVLTIVLGVSTGKGGYIGIILKTLAFFVCAIVVGFIVYTLFRWYALGLSFIFAFCAEKFFGIADITGAYIAGIVLCNLSDASYMESKIDINGYMLFSPIFFASIGLKTNLSGFNTSLLLFSIAFVVVGCISKVIGCGGISKLLGFNWKESYQIGLGMMVRGEVALIVASKGLAVGLIDSKYFSSVILLIIVSSMIVPVLMKKAFKEKNYIED